MGEADFPFVQVLGHCVSGIDASVIDKNYFLIRAKHLQTSSCFYRIMLLLSVTLSICSQLLLVLPITSDPLYYKGFPIYFKSPYQNSDPYQNSESKYTSLLSFKDNTEEDDDDDIATSQSNDIFSEEALKQEFQQQGVMPVAETPVLTTDVVQKGVYDPSYYNNYAQYLMEAYRSSESINNLNKQHATTNYQNFYYPKIKTNLPIKNNFNSHKTTNSPSKLMKNYKVKAIETKKVKIPDYNKFSKDGGDNRKFLNLFNGFFKGGTHDHFKVYKVHKKPYPYNFGYKVNDYYGNSQWRNEVGDKAGAKRGSYGYVDAHGVRREVHYVADHKGFRAWIKTNEPGTANSNPASVLITHQSPPLITNYVKKPAHYPSQNFKLPLLKLPLVG